MTTDEIRALIAKKISGQGSAIDVGNGLEPILNALCDALDAAQAAAPKVLNCGVAFSSGLSGEDLTLTEVAELLNISEQEATQLVNGYYDKLGFSGGIFFLNNSITSKDGVELFGGRDPGGNIGSTLLISRAGESIYSITRVEV